MSLNGMHAGSWFSLGCAAMRAENWKVSCGAFRRKLDIDEGDFECWNNLARGYVMLKQKKRAFYAMREACKHEYENWKVWENFLVMSIDAGAFAEVLRSVGRLLDLTKQFDDAEVLSILLRAVVDPEVGDIDDRPATGYYKGAADLVKRIKGSSKLSPQSWRAIATFHEASGEPDVAQLARRSAFQGAKSVEKWERDDDAVTLVVDTLEDMIGGCGRAGVLKDLNTAKLLAGSAKKVLTNAVATDFGTDSNKEQLARLETKYAELEAAIAAAKASA